jgi:hypothetical protein
VGYLGILPAVTRSPGIATKHYTHIASFGEKGERFLQASVKANSNALFSWKITAKSLQDRYLKLQSEFDKGDNANRLLSGVGGESGELEELLSEMRKTRQDLEKSKNAVKENEVLREAEKERLRAALRNFATRRKSTGQPDPSEPRNAANIVEREGSGSCEGAQAVLVSKVIKLFKRWENGLVWRHPITG